MPKICLITGTHLRHMFLRKCIEDKFTLSGVVLQVRENIIPEEPSFVNEVDKKNYLRHFFDRDNAEKKYFKESISKPKCDTLEISSSELNSIKVEEFIGNIKPDIVITFGCGILKESLFRVLPKYTINLHLGLSPRYRGVATLFWPFYFLEPNNAGSTIHIINSGVDTGDIIHQVLPDLRVADGIHDVACKTVIKSASEIVKLIELFDKQKFWNVHKQKFSGKLFTSKDFRPEHLRVIYDPKNDNNMVKLYIEKKIKPQEPKIFSQFESLSSSNQ